MSDFASNLKHELTFCISGFYKTVKLSVLGTCSGLSCPPCSKFGCPGPWPGCSELSRKKMKLSQFD